MWHLHLGLTSFLNDYNQKSLIKLPLIVFTSISQGPSFILGQYSQILIKVFVTYHTNLFENKVYRKSYAYSLGDTPPIHFNFFRRQSGNKFERSLLAFTKYFDVMSYHKLHRQCIITEKTRRRILAPEKKSTIFLRPPKLVQCF